MPAAVVWAISAIGAAIGGTAGAFLVMYATEVAVAAIIAGGLAYSASAKRKAERMARAQFNAAQVDRLVNVATTVMPRELVLGRVRKGGAIFFRGATDTNNTRFVMLVALAGHEIDAVEAIYLNDELVTLDGSGWVTTAPYESTSLISVTETFTGTSITLAYTPLSGSHVSVTRVNTAANTEYGAVSQQTEEVPFVLAGALVTVDAAYNGYLKTVQYQYQEVSSAVKITSHLGTAGQTADAGMITDFPTLWTSAHRARGVAYLKCEFWYNESAFPSGLPNVTAVIRGAKCYDPRTGLTVWTENPAIMARHILTHPQFGKRASITAAEDVRITAAANACDVATVYTVGGVAQASRALYQASIVIPFGATARDALDDLVQAMAGQWAYAAGEFYLRAGSYSASVQTLTDADLAVVQRGADGAVNQSPVQIITHKARDQMFNIVTATIWDKDQDYKQSTLTPLKGSALITRDGAELVQDVSMPAVFYAPQAQHIGGIMLRDARDPLSVTLPFKLSAYRIELFDTVSLTLTRYGWSAKTFMVLGREWTHDGAIKLTLKENVASTYTMDADFSAQGGAANTALPNAWYVPALAGLSAASGQAQAQRQADGSWTCGLSVSWTAFTDLSVTQGGEVEVAWIPASDASGVWRTARTSGAETSLALTGLIDGAHYVIRARARTPLAVGAWCAQVVHQVLGVGQVVATFYEQLENWPGTKSQGEVVAGGILETGSSASQAWSGKATWADFTLWRTSVYAGVAYATPVRDLGAAMVVSLGARVTVDDGYLYSLQWRGSTVSAVDVLTQPAVDADVTQEARWIIVEMVVLKNPAPAPQVVTIRELEYSLLSRLRRQVISNLSIATLPAANRITVGDVSLPAATPFTRITSVAVTIVDARQGVWSWSLLTRNSPRVQFRLNGDLADPDSIDATLEGY